MPAIYEAIRNQLMKKGVPEQKAKQEAAATYNKKRKPGTPPVTRYSDKKGK